MITEMIIGFVSMLIIGMFIGFIGSKFFSWVMNLKIKKDFNSFLQGNYKNEINIDGKVMKVEKFKMRDEAGNLILVDLQDPRSPQVLPVIEKIVEEIIPIKEEPIEIEPELEEETPAPIKKVKKARKKVTKKIQKNAKE